PEPARSRPKANSYRTEPCTICIERVSDWSRLLRPRVNETREGNGERNRRGHGRYGWHGLQRAKRRRLYCEDREDGTYWEEEETSEMLTKFIFNSNVKECPCYGPLKQ